MINVFLQLIIKRPDEMISLVVSHFDKTNSFIIVYVFIIIIRLTDDENDRINQMWEADKKYQNYVPETKLCCSL